MPFNEAYTNSIKYIQASARIIDHRRNATYEVIIADKDNKFTAYLVAYDRMFLYKGIVIPVEEHVVHPDDVSYGPDYHSEMVLRKLVATLRAKVNDAMQGVKIASSIPP